ncbi:MAG: hypothetical protein IT244_07020 [Bacteroidia bacterium]|nr:hypothetical protein [Bacteroidia bacterium]
MFKSVKLLGLFSSIAFLSSCGGGAATKNEKKQSDSSKGVVADSLLNKKWDRKYNDYSRFLAGLPALPGATISFDDSSSSGFISFKSNWENMEKQRLVKMREWANTELYTHIKRQDKLFYPFSGADFLHAYQFFPDAKSSLYLANESVGVIPDLEKMTPAQRANYHKQIEKALMDIFKKSYFITSHMMDDIPEVKGLIPIYMVFMAKTGHEVLNIELIDLSKDGVIARTGKATGAEGVRITYRPEGKTNDIRVLEYFNCDATDKGMQNKPQVLAYVRKFGKCNVFFKAASYLMHWDFFSEIRNATIEVADGIVEDDTGIPLKYLSKDFNYWLYGRYSKPVKDFGKGGYQPDLAKAYGDSTKVKSLPFSLGYHWQDHNQNYMVYKRK